MSASLDPEEQEAQATLMVAHRVQGRSVAEIAKMFGCAEITVHRRLRLARKRDLLEKAVDNVLENLLDTAVQTYKTLLTDPATPAKVKREAAHDLAFGTGVLSKNNKAQVDPQENLSPRERVMNLRAWREKRLAKTNTPRKTKNHPPKVIDLEPLPPSKGGGAADVQEKVEQLHLFAAPTLGAQKGEEGDFEGDGEDRLFGTPQFAGDDEIEEEI